ncbi:hypothetical protein BH10BAC4_BH10BAC4_08770 [soil metagenome]
MKTKVIILSAIFAVFSLALASTSIGKDSKLKANQSTSETKVAKGISMEDKDQFN